ncbi:hypothetical protein P4O66_016574 [Electrophorus voltai]|uniref:Uncharacterized protein n=1 Tax=Electrophorus voltai TaxID=2609070 RepID=A0AAD8YY39_9TELE|nr:hypothetical protein P4O66_016574 [Electrophorus voltai]
MLDDICGAARETHPAMLIISPSSPSCGRESRLPIRGTCPRFAASLLPFTQLRALEQLKIIDFLMISSWSDKFPLCTSWSEQQSSLSSPPPLPQNGTIIVVTDQLVPGDVRSSRFCGLMQPEA